MLNNYLVGEQRLSDGYANRARLGPLGEMLTGEVSGKHSEHLMRGRLFLYTINSQALVLSATGGGCPTIINAANSGILFIPLALRIGFISGTTTIGSVLIAKTANVGNGAATGAPVVTATLVAAQNALVGAGRVSQVQWSPTTNTFTAAPTVITPTCINLGTADPTNGGNPHVDKFDGTLGFMPGTAMSIVYSVTTSTALFQVTMWGLELPIPSQSY